MKLITLTAKCAFQDGQSLPDLKELLSRALMDDAMAEVVDVQETVQHHAYPDFDVDDYGFDDDTLDRWHAEADRALEIKR